KAQFMHFGNRVLVSAVEEDFLPEMNEDFRKIDEAELLPFCDQGDCIGLIGRLVLIFAKLQMRMVPGKRANIGRRKGIVGAHEAAVVKQVLDQTERGSFSDIVRIGFERKAPDRNGLSLRAALPGKTRMNLFWENRFLLLIDCINSF